LSEIETAVRRWPTATLWIFSYVGGAIVLIFRSTRERGAILLAGGLGTVTAMVLPLFT